MTIKGSLECMAVESTFAQAGALGELDEVSAALQLTAGKRKRALMQTFGYGAGAVALYAAMFANADAIMEITKKGGVMAAVPLALAFLFSYVHGHFTGAFWTALGIDASSKTKIVSKDDQVKPTVTKDRRVRATLRV